jgi:hypothetical protein
LAHRPAGALWLGHVCDNPSGHFHGHKGIAVDVGIRGEPKIFEAFTEIDFAPVCAGQRAQRSTAEQAQAAHCRVSPGYLHGSLLLIAINAIVRALNEKCPPVTRSCVTES